MKFEVGGFRRTARVVGAADPTEVVCYEHKALGLVITECHGVVQLEGANGPTASLLAIALHDAAERAFVAEQFEAEVRRSWAESALAVLDGELVADDAGAE